MTERLRLGTPSAQSYRELIGDKDLHSTTRFPVVSIMVLLCALNVGASDAETERLKAEALEHWRRLEAAGSHLRGSFTHTAHAPKSPETLLYKGRFLVSGPSAWVKLVEPDPGAVDGAGAESVYGKTSEYVFTLKRDPGAKSYLLSSFSEPNPQADERIQGYLTSYAAVPWSVEFKNLSDLGTDPEFKLDSIQREPTNENFVQMKARFSAVMSKGTRGEFSEKVGLTASLDAGRHWAIRSYECIITRFQNGRSTILVAKGLVEYREDVAGALPVPIRHTVILSDPDGSERGTTRIDYPEWIYGDKSRAEEIGLAAFGLPEPVAKSVQQHTGIPTYIWLIGVAGLCAILSAVLHRVAHRKRSTSVSV